MEGYDEFARYYDAFTAGSDYESWRRTCSGSPARHGLTGERLLDLACGTGKSFVPFLRRGFDVDRLRQLAPRCSPRPPARRRTCALVQADIRALPPLGSFDLVTCFDDSLNYLLDERRAGVRVRLYRGEPGAHGLAMFDLNTLHAYRTTFACDSVFERDGDPVPWRGGSAPDVAPGLPAAAVVDVFASRPDGLYERVTTATGSATSRATGSPRCWPAPASSASACTACSRRKPLVEPRGRDRAS